MAISKKPHIFLAAIFVASGVMVLLFGLSYKADFCSRLSSTEPFKVVSYFTRTSDSMVEDRPTVLLVSAGLASFALIPWLRFRSQRDIKFFNSHYSSHPSIDVLNLMKTFNTNPGHRELWNVVIYLFMSITFCVFLGFIMHKPEALFWTETPPVEDMAGIPVKCYHGFGAFIWFDIVLFMICIGCFTMTVLSSLNIQKGYRQYEQHKNIAMSDIENSFIRSNSVFWDSSGSQLNEV